MKYYAIADKRTKILVTSPMKTLEELIKKYLLEDNEELVIIQFKEKR